MLQIVLYYNKNIYDIFNVEDGYIIIENRKIYPNITYNEKYNLFTFYIADNITYTVKINIDNKFYDCFTQPLYLNAEIMDPLTYKINFIESESLYSFDDEEDSCG